MYTHKVSKHGHEMETNCYSSIKGDIGLKMMMTPKDYSSAVCSYG
jgi:hypothetical protein